MKHTSLSLLSCLSALLLASCTPHQEEDYYGTSQEPGYLPDGRVFDRGKWAYDTHGPEYGDPHARKIRFRDSWMSFHNYDTPGDSLDHMDEFERWYAAEKTDHVENGKENEFIIELLG